MIVLATSNKGKKTEIEKILSQVSLISDFGNFTFPEEDGKTFFANARIKAHFAAKVTGKPSLADDSGLCVDSLNGAPGIYSARYGGETNDCVDYLLSQLKKPSAAHFFCAVCLAFPDGREILTSGKVFGEIILQRRGTNGFGYDPIFYLPEKQKTMAELSSEEKNMLSHRYIALSKLKGVL